jgi:hypothetical protein
MRARGTGVVPEEEAGQSAAAREARDCGAMDSTGTRYPGEPGLGFSLRMVRTSV